MGLYTASRAYLNYPENRLVIDAFQAHLRAGPRTNWLGPRIGHLVKELRFRGNRESRIWYNDAIARVPELRDTSWLEMLDYTDHPSAPEKDLSLLFGVGWSIVWRVGERQYALPLTIDTIAGTCSAAFGAGFSVQGMHRLLEGTSWGARWLVGSMMVGASALYLSDAVVVDPFHRLASDLENRLKTVESAKTLFSASQDGRAS